jgi:hypothetical protein
MARAKLIAWPRVARNCPMRRNYFGVVIAESGEDNATNTRRLRDLRVTCLALRIILLPR